MTRITISRINAIIELLDQYTTNEYIIKRRGQRAVILIVRCAYEKDSIHSFASLKATYEYLVEQLKNWRDISLVIQ